MASNLYDEIGLRLTGDNRALAPPSIHLGIIDSLRGIAALTIVVYHLFENSGAPQLRFFGVNVLRPLHDGWAGVNLFLVLSGFCLYWPYARANRKIAFFKFMQRRSWRILPAYYASLFVAPSMFSIVHRMGIFPSAPSEWPTGVLDVLLHLTMLHSLWAGSIWSWNGVTWSLGLEWTWYLIFPAAAWAMSKRAAMTLGVMFASSLIYRFSLYWLAGPTSRWSTESGMVLRTFLAGRLAEFGSGMFVAWWLANRHSSKWLVQAAVVGVFVLLVAAHEAAPADPFLPYRDMLYGLGFAALVFVCVEKASMLRDGWFLQGIGEYSYSLYLFHMPFVLIACGLTRLVLCQQIN